MDNAPIADATTSPVNISASNNAQGDNAPTASPESANVSSQSIGELNNSNAQADSVQPGSESQVDSRPTVTAASVNTNEPTNALSSVNQGNTEEKAPTTDVEPATDTVDTTQQTGEVEAPQAKTDASIAPTNDVEPSSTKVVSNDEVKSTGNNDTQKNDELTEELPVDAMQFLTDNEVGPQEFESESGEKYTRVGSLGSAEDPIGNVYVNSEGNAFYNDGFSSKLEDYGDLSSIDYVKQ